MFLYNYHF